jgi:ribosomal protein L37AE/L43A
MYKKLKNKIFIIIILIMFTPDEKRLEDIYDEMIHPDFVEPKRAILGVCSDCDKDMIIENDMWLCMHCGDMMNGCISIENPGETYAEDTLNRRKKSIYSRRMYFVEKMNLICGYKRNNSDTYQNVVDEVSSYRFDTIAELRHILKKKIKGGYKFYKHAHNIYADIKGVRLIELTQQQIQQLSQKFVVMDISFRGDKDNHKRKNMFSYQTIIYNLLKQENIPGYDSLFLPKHHKEITTTFCKV